MLVPVIEGRALISFQKGLVLLC